MGLKRKEERDRRGARLGRGRGKKMEWRRKAMVRFLDAFSKETR